MAKVLIEVPTYDGSISRATSESLWNLDRAGHEVDYRPRAGYGIDMARNRIAADALDGGYDRVLMVDNDIELPPDALRLLMEHRRPIVMGWYLNRHRRGGRRLATVFREGSDWEMYDQSEVVAMRDAGETLVKVKAGGMGCCLISTDVFKLMPFPWFEWTDEFRMPRFVTDLKGCADAFSSGGEDINFCKAATRAGFPIFADVRVACGHEFREVVWPS